jgi:hypothetical protein
VLADDPLCVAVIEQWRGDRVAVREVLTREHLTELMHERGSGRLIGGDARESEGRVLFGGVEVGTERTEEEPDEDEERQESFFDESLSRMLAEEGRDLSVAESETSESSAPAPRRDRTPPPGMDPRIWRIILDQEDEDSKLEVGQRRVQIRFERATIQDWVDRTLVALEARRRGHQVTEAQMAEALVPMIQARRSQLANQMERGAGETVITEADLRTLDETITLIQRDPKATADPGVRLTLRGEIEEILAEEGHDSERFFAELEANLLADQLIRAAVNEYVSEDDLRTYHSAFTEEFLIQPRHQYLSIKLLAGHVAQTGRGVPAGVVSIREEIEAAHPAFRGLARRLRRIDEDEPLDDVIAEWKERMDDEEDLPGHTYMALSNFQTEMEMPREIARVIGALEPGETSGVLEGARGLFIVRLVDRLPLLGLKFEEARPQVEERFFDEIRARLLEILRQERYRVIIRRRGAPLSELLEALGSPDSPAAL